MAGIYPVALAQLFHEHYERLAPEHGYETRPDSAVAWDNVPDNNRSLMIATAAAVLRSLKGAGYVIVAEAVGVKSPDDPTDDNATGCEHCDCSCDGCSQTCQGAPIDSAPIDTSLADRLTELNKRTAWPESDA